MEEGSQSASFDVVAYLKQSTGMSVATYPENQIVYAQGDPADSVFYIHNGKVKVTVISEHGREAVVAIRGPDEFCGEGALNGSPRRLATTTTMSPCEVIRLDIKTMVRLLHDSQDFTNYFLSPSFDSGPPGSKRTWSISYSIPARCGWHGHFCCWLIMAATPT